MFIFVLVTIILPLVVVIIFTIFKAAIRANTSNPLTWNDCNNLAYDFMLLSLGATGGIFTNNKILEHWNRVSPVLVYATVLGILFAGAIILLKEAYRTKNPRHITKAQGVRDLLWGLYTLVIVYLIIHWGYLGVPKVISDLLGELS